jgi:hypothetical protein
LKTLEAVSGKIGQTLPIRANLASLDEALKKLEAAKLV